MPQVETAKSSVGQAILNTEPTRARSRLVALAATILSPFIVLVVDAFLRAPSLRWMLFLPAVFVCAWWGGYATGIAATLLSAALMWWRFVPPEHVILKPAGPRYLVTLTFIGLGVVLTALVRRLRSRTAELAQGRSFLQSVLDHSPNGVVMKDLEGRYVVANKAFERLTGVSPQEALHHTDQELFPNDFADAFRANDKLVRETGAPQLFEKKLEVDGFGHLMVSAYPLRDASGSVFATGATLVDVTQLKRGETALREAMEDLRTAQHVAHVGSWRWNFRTGEARWSEELYQIFGIDTSTSAVPIVSPGLKLLTAESIDRLRAAIEKLRADGEPYELDLEFTRPDGVTRWCTARGEAVRDPDGNIIGINSTAADVTHIKELERLRDEWTSIVAHDLRQPIAFISMASDFFPELAGPASDQEQELLRRIHTAADTLKRMVDDLLDLSLLEANRLKLVRKETDPRQLVRDTVESVSRVSGCHVNIDEQGPIPCIAVDSMRIGQVLANVLNNAVKYGDASADIDVRLQCAGTDVRISITNRGAGLDPQEMARLFSRFARGKALRDSTMPGLGLGLYISKGIVEAHGGRLWAESTPGQTTTFHIALPTTVPQVQAA